MKNSGKPGLQYQKNDSDAYLKKMKRLFITGTGTDVGKTIATAGIAALAVESGMRVAVIKPVQTGVPEYTPDIREIRVLSPGILNLSEESASAYTFSLPASPHLAAAEEGKIVSMRTMLDFVEKVERNLSPDILIIEGAGGVLVPLNDNETFTDFMIALGAPVLVVALAGLGTINHTLLTLEHLKRNAVAVAGVIINRYPTSPSVIERDNVTTIEKFSGVRVLARIKEISTVAPRTLLEEFKDHQDLLDLII